MNIDEIIDKIKKAVRLANKTTSEGERDTALRLARRLAERNGVAFEEVAEDAGEGGDDGRAVVESDGDETRRPNNADMGFIAYILKQHFGVVFMMHVNPKRRGVMRVSWVGSRLNIDIARHVCHILVRESGRAWREAKHAAERDGRKPLDRTAFMRGFFWAIARKLAEYPLRNDLDDAIRKAERRLLEYQMEAGNAKMLHSRSSGRGMTDVDALARGFGAGQGVSLARPCEGKGESPLALGHCAGRLELAT